MLTFPKHFAFWSFAQFQGHGMFDVTLEKKKNIHPVGLKQISCRLCGKKQVYVLRCVRLFLVAPQQKNVGW